MVILQYICTVCNRHSDYSVDMFTHRTHVVCRMRPAYLDSIGALSNKGRAAVSLLSQVYLVSMSLA